MASSTRSTLEPIRSALGRTVEPVRGPVSRTVGFLTGSFFRFLIFLGLLLLGMAMVTANGVIAGHLGIYGVSAVLIGVLGRAVVRWKLRHSV